MITSPKKTLAMTVAIATSLLLTSPALANGNSNTVNQQAVNQFTNSIRDALSAYDSLERGDVTAAKSKLEQALKNLRSAIDKDSTLGFSQKWKCVSQRSSSRENQVKL